MDHLKNIDIFKCADELTSVFKEFLYWLSEQKPEPLNTIAIGWSSNFEKETAFGGATKKILYRWPGTFDFSKWFLSERPNDLDHEDLSSVRYAVSSKIAEIACLTSEELVELEIFKKLPKLDGFTMKVKNRTAGVPPIFYPFK